MILRFFISLALATGASYVFFDFIYHRRILAALIWIVVYIVSWRILKRLTGGKKAKTGQNPFRTIEDEKLIKAGMEKLRGIRNLTTKIASNDIAKKVQDICSTGAEIFTYIQNNPNDLNRAKQFINYYLDATAKIINRYVELLAVKDKSAEIEASLKKVEEMLSSIDTTFKKQLHNLMEDDVLDLNTEIRVLETTIKMEG